VHHLQRAELSLILIDRFGSRANAEDDTTSGATCSACAVDETARLEVSHKPWRRISNPTDRKPSNWLDLKPLAIAVQPVHLIRATGIGRGATLTGYQPVCDKAIINLIKGTHRCVSYQVPVLAIEVGIIRQVMASVRIEAAGVLGLDARLANDNRVEPDYNGHA
jgi:hypothetical protein